MSKFIEEMTSKIEEIKAKNSKERDSIVAAIATEVKNRDAALKDMENATAALDAEKYDKAKRAKIKAANGIEMYERRLGTLDALEAVPEGESIVLIQSIIDHENELSEAYLKEVKSLFASILKVHREYRQNVKSCEALIHKWTSEVANNYRRWDRDGSMVEEKSDKPYPARGYMPYYGCKESDSVESVLRTLEGVKFLDNTEA